MAFSLKTHEKLENHSETNTRLRKGGAWGSHLRDVVAKTFFLLSLLFLWKTWPLLWLHKKPLAACLENTLNATICFLWVFFCLWHTTLSLCIIVDDYVPNPSHAGGIKRPLWVGFFAMMCALGFKLAAFLLY